MIDHHPRHGGNKKTHAHAQAILILSSSPHRQRLVTWASRLQTICGALSWKLTREYLFFLLANSFNLLEYM
jgi:hypothetical protein